MAQYLSAPLSPSVFEELFKGHSFVVGTAFFGFSKTAQLLYGLFAAGIDKNRFVNLYFFAFSQVVYIIVHVLLFDSRAYALATVFSVVLIFFTLCHILCNRQKRKAALLVVPQVSVGIFVFVLSVLKIF